MKSHVLSFIAGIVITLAAVWIFKPQFHDTAVVKRSAADDGDVIASHNIAAQNKDLLDLDTTNVKNSDQSNLVITTEAPSEASETAKKRSTAMTGGGINEHTSKIILNGELNKARRQLKKLLPKDSPKLDALVLAANEKIKADMEIFNEINQEFNPSDYFDEEGKPIERELSADRLAEQSRVLEERLARRERIRERFEDSITNLLSDSELEAYREHELSLANQSDQRLIRYQTESIEDGVPDLNDYQLNEIQRFVSAIEPLTLDDVPIGSQLGMPFTLHTDSDNRISTLTSQMESLLSPSQQATLEEHRRNNGFVTIHSDG